MRLLFSLPLVLAYLLASVVGTKALRSFLSLQSLDDLIFWRHIEPPDVDSTDRDCEKWLRTRPSSLIYPYGVNTTSSGARSLLTCLQRPDAENARCAITEISVAFPATGEPNYKQQPLFQLVDILPNLKTIKWPESRRNHPGHKKLIDWGVLSQRPSPLSHDPCHPAQPSRIRSWTVIVPYSDLDPPPHLIECNSDAADLFIPRWAHGGQAQLNHLYETLVSCPNIRCLSLDIRPGFYQYSFPLKPGDRFPNITELRISGYDWGKVLQAPAISWWNPISWFDRSARFQGNAALWKAAMSWPCIKKLDIDRPSATFLKTFQEELKSLDSLTIRPRFREWDFDSQSSTDGAAEEEHRLRDLSLITSLPPLKSLSINGLAGVLNISAILDSHGQSLKNLALRNLSPDGSFVNMDDKGPVPSTRLHEEDLDLLARSAPLLEKVELDATGNPRVLDFLDAPQTLPHLKEVTVHIPLAGQEGHLCALKLGITCFVSQSLSKPSNYADTSRRLRGTIVRESPQTERVSLYRGDSARRDGEDWQSTGDQTSSSRWLCSSSTDEEGGRRENCLGAPLERERNGLDPNAVIDLSGLLEGGGIEDAGLERM